MTFNRTVHIDIEQNRTFNIRHKQICVLDHMLYFDLLLPKKSETFFYVHIYKKSLSFCFLQLFIKKIT